MPSYELEGTTMAIELPAKFLEWNYFSRRNSIKDLLEGKYEKDMNRFFLDSTRHNPALCTALVDSNGRLRLNAKIVGIGYVLKEAFLPEGLAAFSFHIESADEEFETAQTSNEKDRFMKTYQSDGMRLLLEHIYLEPEQAKHKVDFTKMSTIELAMNRSSSSKHTWRIVQQSKTACLLFYKPPNLSFELHGSLEIHNEGLYYRFVNAVHDVFHYVPSNKRELERPVYLFRVEEVYDNSPTPQGFGARIA